MTGRGRLPLIAVVFAGFAIAAAVLLWNGDDGPRQDALIHHTPDPSRMLTPGESPKADEPYEILRDLMDPEAARRGSVPVAPGERGSPSDVVGFWRRFEDHLLRAGVRPVYVQALEESHGTNAPRDFVAADPADIAAAMMTALNPSHTGEVYLVTEEEAAALQRIASELVAEERP